MIRVNDRWDIHWRQGMTVDDLLIECGFTHHYVVVTVNGTVVPPDQHSSHLVRDGDQVQAIHIIGGG